MADIGGVLISSIEGHVVDFVQLAIVIILVFQCWLGCKRDVRLERLKSRPEFFLRIFEPVSPATTPISKVREQLIIVYVSIVDWPRKVKVAIHPINRCIDVVPLIRHYIIIIIWEIVAVPKWRTAGRDLWEERASGCPKVNRPSGGKGS